jgi:hypothetical protein
LIEDLVQQREVAGTQVDGLEFGVHTGPGSTARPISPRSTPDAADSTAGRVRGAAHAASRTRHPPLGDPAAAAVAISSDV